MKFYSAMCSTSILAARRIGCENSYIFEVNKQIIMAPYYIRDWDDCSWDGDEGTGNIKIGIAITEPHLETKIEEYIYQACKEWGVSISSIRNISECTFYEFANTNHYDFNLKKVLQQRYHALEFIEMIGKTFRHAHIFWDYILPDKQSTAAIKKLLHKSSYSIQLGQEIELIKGTKHNCAHLNTNKPSRNYVPVHYVIEGTNPNDYQPALDILLGTLKNENRLPSDHVYTLDFDLGIINGEINRHDRYPVDKLVNEAFADALLHNTVIVKYGQYDTDATYDTEVYSIFSNFINLLQERSDSIQAVFILPENNPDLKLRVQQKFGMPLVVLSPNEKVRASKLSYATCRKHIAKLAKNDGLSLDDSLDKMLKERLKDKSFNDLEGLYKDWKSILLTSKNHPQYLPLVQAAVEQKLSSSRNCSDNLSAAQRLEELVGLESVKQQVKKILQHFEMNKTLAQKGLKPQPISMHMAFEGSPGTGKTEVARLVAEILKEEGVLSEGRLIMRSGGSGFSIKTAFEEARGSVLFIDEAYGMTNTSSSITELIAYMENERDSTVVILAGYKGALERLISYNPGFKSRIGFVIDFPDYTDAEKLDIFKLMTDRAGLIVSDKTLATARDVIARGGTPNDEGNGRFVRKLFEGAIAIKSTRLAENPPKNGYTKKSLITLLPSDILEAAGNQPAKIPGRKALASLIGLVEIKEQISKRLNFMKIQKIKRDAGIASPFVPMHMAFLGNPGSGKTEVARLTAQILKEEGVLSVGECIEVTGNDLMAATYFMSSIFQNAKGSVLFVDEAYTLAASRETVAALIAEMENHRKDVVVIMAGYTKEMEMLFSINPGFASRIKTIIDFPDYSTEELLSILSYMVKKNGMTLNKSAKEAARQILLKASENENFGNARYVRNMFEDAVIRQGSRLINEGIACSNSSNDNTQLDAKSIKKLTTLIADDFDKVNMPDLKSIQTWQDPKWNPVGFLAA